MIAYVGDHGIGKSTILNHIKNEDKFNWINFEAWRYADRSQIWDGFVVEVVSKLDHPEKKNLSAVADEIEGEKRKWLLSGLFIKIKRGVDREPVGFSIIAIAVSLYLGWFIWQRLNSPSAPLEQYLEAFLKFGSISVLFSILAYLGLSSIDSPGKPLKRFFQLEERVVESLSRVKKPTIIIIEDIDRVESSHAYAFLQALKRLLVDQVAPHSIVVIAPQSHLLISDKKNIALDESGKYNQSIKVYDGYFYSRSFNAKTASLDSILQEAQVDSKRANELKSILKLLTSSYGAQLSHRRFKLVLREIGDFMDLHHNANVTLATIFIFSRHITGERYSSSYVMFDLLKRNQHHFNSQQPVSIEIIINEIVKLLNVPIQDPKKLQVDLEYKDLGDKEIILEGLEEAQGLKVLKISIDTKYLQG